MTLSKHRPIVGGGEESGKQKLLSLSDSTKTMFGISKPVLALGGAAYLGVMALSIWFSYAMQKSAIKNGIKEAAADGVWDSKAQRQPVVILSNPQRGASSQATS